VHYGSASAEVSQSGYCYFDGIVQGTPTPAVTTQMMSGLVNVTTACRINLPCVIMIISLQFVPIERLCTVAWLSSLAPGVLGSSSDILRFPMQVLGIAKKSTVA
jgi:hypothetical protein